MDEINGVEKERATHLKEPKTRSLPNTGVCILVRSKAFSCVQLCATPWTVARQALLSIGFSRQEYWSGLPCPLPGDLPNPGIKPKVLLSPALAGRFLTTSTTWEAHAF